jgi:hypothetical protein
MNRNGCPSRPTGRARQSRRGRPDGGQMRRSTTCRHQGLRVRKPPLRDDTEDLSVVPAPVNLVSGILCTPGLMHVSCAQEESRGIRRLAIVQKSSFLNSATSARGRERRFGERQQSGGKEAFPIRLKHRHHFPDQSLPLRSRSAPVLPPAAPPPVEPAIARRSAYEVC